MSPTLHTRLGTVRFRVICVISLGLFFILWPLLGSERAKQVQGIVLIACIFLPWFWNKVPARCPKCQGKTYLVDERTLSELWKEMPVNRYYRCTTCGHEEIVSYVQTKGDR